MITESKPIIEQMRELMRGMNYAYKTENIYCEWVARFAKFLQIKDRGELLENPEDKVEKFLTDLAVKQKVAISTQNQALNSLVVLYSKVLRRPLQNVHPTRSKKQAKILVVLSVKEVKK